MKISEKDVLYVADLANLELTMERWPGVRFRETREHQTGPA